MNYDIKNGLYSDLLTNYYFTYAFCLFTDVHMDNIYLYFPSLIIHSANEKSLYLLYLNGYVVMLYCT